MTDSLAISGRHLAHSGMNRHHSIVSSAFTVTGVLLGLPSLLAFLWLVWASISMYLAKPTGTAGGSGGPDSLINLLVGGARIFGKTLSLFADAMQALIGVLAVVAFFLLCFASILLLVGRGLQRHRLWARIVGMLLAFGLLLTSVASLALLHRTVPALTALLLAMGCVYTLWVLFRRFA